MSANDILSDRICASAQKVSQADCQAWIRHSLSFLPRSKALERDQWATISIPWRFYPVLSRHRNGKRGWSLGYWNFYDWGLQDIDGSAIVIPRTGSLGTLTGRANKKILLRSTTFWWKTGNIGRPEPWKKSAIAISPIILKASAISSFLSPHLSTYELMHRLRGLCRTNELRNWIALRRKSIQHHILSSWVEPLSLPHWQQ